MKALRVIVLFGAIVLIIPFVILVADACNRGYDGSVLQRIIGED